MIAIPTSVCDTHLATPLSQLTPAQTAGHPYSVMRTTRPDGSGQWVTGPTSELQTVFKVLAARLGVKFPMVWLFQNDGAAQLFLVAAKREDLDAAVETALANSIAAPFNTRSWVLDRLSRSVPGRNLVAAAAGATKAAAAEYAELRETPAEFNVAFEG